MIRLVAAVWLFLPHFAHALEWSDLEHWVKAPNILASYPSEWPVQPETVDRAIGKFRAECPSFDFRKFGLAPTYGENSKFLGFMISLGTWSELKSGPFKNYDVLTEIDGQPVESQVTNLCSILLGKTKQTVTVLRDEEYLEIELGGHGPGQGLPE